MTKKKQKPVRVVSGNDFVKVYLRYGIERLLDEGHCSIGEVSSFDNNGEFTKKLLNEPAFRKHREKAKVKDSL